MTQSVYDMQLRNIGRAKCIVCRTNPTVGRVSRAGTNLKVGGHRSGAKRRKIFFGRAPPLFWLKKYNSSFW